jgi:N-acetylglutamate synthase-like GNAT family acetyltransferase
MYIEKFNVSHMTTILGWLRARNCYLPSYLEMPETGFVAMYRGEPVAMAFIRKVEGGFAQLDGLTSNPDFPGDMRSEAIDCLVSHLMKQAKGMGIKSVMAYTKDENTLVRSAKHGFVVVPQTLIVADLTSQA